MWGVPGVRKRRKGYNLISGISLSYPAQIRDFPRQMGRATSASGLTKGRGGKEESAKGLDSSLCRCIMIAKRWEVGIKIDSHNTTEEKEILAMSPPG